MSRPLYAQAEKMRRRGYVNVGEAARMCGVGVSAIYKWLGAEKIEGMSVGRSRYVKLASLSRYLGPSAAVLGIPATRK